MFIVNLAGLPQHIASSTTGRFQPTCNRGLAASPTSQPRLQTISRLESRIILEKIEIIIRLFGKHPVIELHEFILDIPAPLELSKKKSR